MAVIDKTSVEQHLEDAVCVAYSDNQVFSGGADGKIKIWDNDLNLKRTIDAHEGYIYALAVNKNGKLYSSSCDGFVKYIVPPYECLQELLRCDDVIQALYCDNDILFSGDDKGVVTNWKDDKMLFKFNLVEEVKSLAAEQSLIYTVRDLDVVVSDVVAGKSGKYSNKAVIAGKSPLLLLGPTVDNKKTYLAFADRSGKGLLLCKNLPTYKFAQIWHMQDCHEMIINAICGDEKCIYSGGYDGKVKGWTDLEQSQPKPLGEVQVGSCVNQICCGRNNYLYIVASDGFIRRAKFM